MITKASPRSIQQPPPYLTRSVFRFADPTGLSGEQWRLIAREPVNRMAQRFIVRELTALEYVIVAKDRKDDDRADGCQEDWDGMFEHGEGFDIWLGRMIEDACTLPFGAASEIGYKGKELTWLLHVDGATLWPTYEQKVPYCQINPDNWTEKVFFTKDQLARLRVGPRPDLRFKEYQTSPTEDAYLAIQALSRIYLYYMQQLGDTPPPGILDVGDMTYDDAVDWAKHFRETIEGVDPIKIPILYDHEKPASWISFGQTPQDLNVLEQFKRFAEILLGKYGLSIGDLRLFEHESTKAGERVSQLVTERSGIGFWAATIEAFFNRLMPVGLLFKFKQPRPERELVDAQRKQVQVATLLQATGNKTLMSPEDAVEQSKDWELFTIEFKPPEPEPVPPALAAANQQQQPTQEELDQTEEVRDAFDDADLGKKAAAIVKAELGEWKDPTGSAVDRLLGFVRDYFKDVGGAIDESQVEEAMAKVRGAIQAGSEPLEEKGGEGSGYYGHGGRPGQRGGSAGTALAGSTVEDGHVMVSGGRISGQAVLTGSFEGANESDIAGWLRSEGADHADVLGMGAMALESDLDSLEITNIDATPGVVSFSFEAHMSDEGREAWDAIEMELEETGAYYSSYAKAVLTDVVEGRLHEAFTVALDRAFQLGYINRDARISASSVIGDWLPQLSTDLLQRVAGVGAEVEDEDLRTIAKAIRKALTLDEISTLIDDLLDRSLWWQISVDKMDDIQAVLKELYAHGLNVDAGRIEKLRLGLGEVPSMSIDWNLRDPVVEELIGRHAAEMVTNVNNGTKFYLREMILEGVEQGWSKFQIVEHLQSDLFGLPSGEASKFTQERLGSIVNYEVNKAMSAAGFALRDSLGLESKQWFTNRVSPCEICLDNEARGVVPSSFQYDGVFGAILYPPAHPQTCRCVVTAVESEVHALGSEAIAWPFTIKAFVTSLEKGGEGSGHFGHGGRRGQRGGSAPKGAAPDTAQAGYKTRGEVLKKWGLWDAQLNSLIKYGMPSVKQGKQRLIKWPEAEQWYETYQANGKGKAGIKAANEALGTTGKDVPKPPKPPDEPQPPSEPPTVGEGPYEGTKVYTSSEASVGNAAHINFEGFGPTEVGTRRDTQIALDALKRLPQEHLDSIRKTVSMTGSEADDLWGEGWSNNVGGWMDRQGKMGLMYSDNGNRRWDKSVVLHEAGHAVHNQIQYVEGFSSRQEAARGFFGDEAARKTKAGQIRNMFNRATQSGKGFVTDYSKTNAKEFFAESYQFYTRRPGTLKTTNSAMYDFLKRDVFGGMEYSALLRSSTVR